MLGEGGVLFIVKVLESNYFYMKAIKNTQDKSKDNKFIEEIIFEEDFPPFKKWENIHLKWTIEFQKIANFYLKNVKKIKDNEKFIFNDRLKLNLLIWKNWVWKTSLFKKIYSKSFYNKQIILDSYKNQNNSNQDPFSMYNFMNYNSTNWKILRKILWFNHNAEIKILGEFSNEIKLELYDDIIIQLVTQVFNHKKFLDKIWEKNLIYILLNSIPDFEKKVNEYIELLRYDYLNYTNKFEYKKLKNLILFIDNLFIKVSNEKSDLNNVLKVLDEWSVKNDFEEYFEGDKKVSFLEYYNLQTTKSKIAYFFSRIKNDRINKFSFEINSLENKFVSENEQSLFSIFCTDIRFVVDWFDYNNFSSWEKKILSRFTSTYMRLLKDSETFSDFIILIDEPDLHIHLDWQKQYIQRLIDIFSTLPDNINIQFIIATHSPFIVSDLPKSCIVRLGEWKKLSIPKSNQTFGANFIDIINDEFYFENNSLMWSFSENVIKQISILEQMKLSKDYQYDESIKEFIWNKFLKDNLIYFNTSKWD